MKASILLLVVFMSWGLSLAQTAIPSQLRAEYTFNALTDANGLGNNEVLSGVPLPPGKVVGDNYLDAEWNRSRIMLYDKNKVIDGYPVRYNIKEQTLEIKSRGGVKVLEASRVKSLALIDSVSGKQRFFINGREYKQGNGVLSGFLEVLSDGAMPLFKRTTIVEKDPNYIPAFDVGSRDTKILKKEVLFYSKQKDLLKVGGKKSIIAAFGEHGDAVEQYIKQNRTDLNDERSLAGVFDYYNTKLMTERAN